MSAAGDYTGWIVRSRAGRDRDALLCVVGMDEERDCLLLADGKRRKLARPKMKRRRHVELLDGSFDRPATQKLRRGEPLTDNELRRTLRAYRDEMEA